MVLGNVQPILSVLGYTWTPLDCKLFLQGVLGDISHKSIHSALGT